MFLLDILVHSFVKVRGKGSSSAFNTPRRLFKRYVRLVFSTQLLPSIIFYCLSNKSVPDWIWWLSGVPRLLPRNARLRAYFKKMEMNLEVDVGKFQMIKFTVVLFLSCHSVGCVYYFLARIMHFKDNTWVGQFEISMPGVFDRVSSAWYEHYLAIVYRGWIGLAPNSYRYPPQNWPEQLWSVVVMFLAMILSAYLLGTVMPYIVKKDPVAEAYQKRRQDLLAFANHRELPTGLVHKMLQYYEFQYSKVRHSSAQVQLSRTLQTKVANKKFRQYVDRNCERGQCFYRCEINFFSALVCMLKELYLMPAEEFIRHGDVARELYFVADGVFLCL